MAVTVKIPTQLRAAAGGESEAELDGATVREVLDSLYEKYDGLGERLADESGSLRRFVNVYLSGEDIRFLNGLDTPVDDRGGVDDSSGCGRRLNLAEPAAGIYAAKESQGGLHETWTRRYATAAASSR